MKKILPVIFAIVIGITIIGCGKSESDAGADDVSKKVIKVGTMGTYEPFSFYDEKDNLTGYDLEVLRAAEKHLDNYTFEFVSGPWDTLFPGLDADTFQLLANQLTSNPDRVEKYLLTDESYFNDISQPIIAGDNDSIKSLKDLADKTVGVTVGDSHARVLEKYNKENGEKINIKYYESDSMSMLQDIVNDRLDACVNNPIMANRTAEKLGLNLKVVEDTLTKDPTIFITKKDADGEALKAALDKALAILKEEGTLSELSKEWFGKDYTE